MLTSTWVSLPNAIETESWQIYLLSFIYLILGASCIYRVVIFFRSIYRKNSVYYFLCLFLNTILAFWRFACYLIPFPWNKFLFLYLGLSIPLLLQIAGSGVFTVFLYSKYLGIVGKEHRMRVVHTVYGVTILCLGIGTALLCRKIELAYGYDTEFNLYIVCLFSILLMLTWVGSALLKREVIYISLSNRKIRKVRIIGGLATCYCVVFCLRFLWSLLNYMSMNMLNSKLVDYGTENRSAYYSIYFCFYCIVEILPLTIFCILGEFVMLHRGMKSELTVERI